MVRWRVHEVSTFYLSELSPSSRRIQIHGRRGRLQPSSAAAPDSCRLPPAELARTVKGVDPLGPVPSHLAPIAQKRGAGAGGQAGRCRDAHARAGARPAAASAPAPRRA